MYLDISKSIYSFIQFYIPSGFSVSRINSKFTRLLIKVYNSVIKSDNPLLPWVTGRQEEMKRKKETGRKEEREGK